MSRTTPSLQATPPASRRRSQRLRRLLVAGVSLLAVLTAGTTAASADDPHAQIQGSGSSWAANAVNQWVADEAQKGVKTVFTSTGSATGRKDFANVITDFGVTDIGYQGTDSSTGQSDTNQGRAFAYLPIVSGGTSFPYQVRVAGQLVKNIRLSGTTLAKIFTNQITNWNDPEITSDNNGRALPSLPIIPVVHQEGSGSTAQFTLWMNSQFPSIWQPFNGGPGSTEYFPRAGDQISANGSDALISYLTSSAANGAIGYDEYSYALAKNYPVIKVENAGNYFTLPTQYNVAVALTQASINMDSTSPNYLLQNLSNVYTDNDPRTYPLSSYSYAIIPLDPNDKTMSTAKRQSIVDFLNYSVCGGQKEIGPIGYSALPVNLVQASFAQISKLHDADPAVDITNSDVSTCDNPTFVPGQPNQNYLAQTAPQPPTCDMSGAGPCAGAGDTGTAVVMNPNTGGKAAASAAAVSTAKNPAAAASKAKASAKATAPTSTSGVAAAPAAAAAATGTTSTTVDPATGAVVAAAAGSTGSGASTAVDPATGAVAATTGSAGADATDPNDTTAAYPAATTLASANVGTSPKVFGGLAGGLLLLVLIGPPLLAGRLKRSRAGGNR